MISVMDIYNYCYILGLPFQKKSRDSCWGGEPCSQILRGRAFKSQYFLLLLKLGGCVLFFNYEGKVDSLKRKKAKKIITINFC